MKKIMNYQFIRFFMVSGFGVVCDIMLAYFFHRFFGLTLYLSTVISLSIIAISTYFIHQLWTFRSISTGFSSSRLIKFLISSIVVLAVRETTLFSLATLLHIGHSWAVAQLVIAAGLSFLVNFVITRYLVFRPT